MRIFLFAGALVLTITPPLHGERQTGQPAGVAQRIVGAWRLEARTVRRADGMVVSDAVLGEKPIGRLFYDASGVMMLQMMRQGRKEAISKPETPKDAANARVVLGYDAYFGSYTIDERAGTITHRVEGSLFLRISGRTSCGRSRSKATR